MYKHKSARLPIYLYGVFIVGLATWLLSVTLWPTNPLSLGGDVSVFRWPAIIGEYIFGAAILVWSFLKREKDKHD